jgi:excisionase family DNA binding protein
MQKKICDNGKWRTREQIAEHFSVSVRTVANLQRRRVLPFCKVGRLVRFNLDDCEKALLKFQVRSVTERV